MTGIAGLDWIAADWGTTHLRVWAMDQTGAVLARGESGQGMASLDRSGYEAALLALVGPWLGSAAVPAVICGMAGSRQGWIEAPYGSVPCLPLVPGRLVSPVLAGGRLRVHIVPGLKQDSPADVMRGEETQIAGFLTCEPGFDGVLCLPGTHTKWVHVSAGEVVSFQTYMTGELFGLIAGQSVLRHGVQGSDWDDDTFADTVGQAMSRPERLAARLFSIRAEGLLAGLAPGRARARLSGLLIGAELAAARPYWLGRDVVVIGAKALCALYGRALGLQGQAVRIQDGEAMALAGLALAHASLKEKAP